MRNWILRSAAALLVLAALTAGAQGQGRRSKAKKRATGQAASAPVTHSHKDGVARITAREAYRAVNSGRAIIVDVRGEDSYRAGHIKGALLMPINDVDRRAGELPREKLIITYCA